MSKRLTRQEMYDLSWSQPMRTLAQGFGISDVGLAKTFRQMQVPIPPRGYWARKTAGKTTVQPPLPPRPVGLADHAWFGRTRQERYYQTLSQEEILGPLPPEPTFDEPMDAVRARIEADVGKVTVARSLESPDPAVGRLLRRDEDKREKQKGASYISSYDALLYDTPPQQRRLRLLNAIFKTAAQHGARADAWGSPDYGQTQDEFVVVVGHQGVRLRAAYIEPSRRAPGAAGREPSRKLRISLEPGSPGSPDLRCWEDDEHSLEHQVRSIVLAILARGEERHRNGEVSTYKWRIKLKADTIERLRKEKEEAERAERARQAELERQRVEALLGQADAFRKAREIRDYVDQARTANLASAAPMAVEEFEAWARWALAQADRLDPVMTGAFRIADAPKP